MAGAQGGWAHRRVWGVRGMCVRCCNAGQILATNKQGHIFIMKFTPELWSVALSTRTQILYEADISAVMMWLDIKAGSIVIEAGTCGCG